MQAQAEIMRMQGFTDESIGRCATLDEMFHLEKSALDNFCLSVDESMKKYGSDDSILAFSLKV